MGRGSRVVGCVSWVGEGLDRGSWVVLLVSQCYIFAICLLMFSWLIQDYHSLYTF